LALELFVEFASGAGDVHPARHSAFPILDALHNARRLGALGTIRALGGIHFLFTVARFRNLCHDLSNLLLFGDPRRRMISSRSLAPFAAAGLEKTNPKQQKMSGKIGPDTSQSSRGSRPKLVYTKPGVRRFVGNPASTALPPARNKVKLLFLGLIPSAVMHRARPAIDPASIGKTYAA